MISIGTTALLSLGILISLFAILQLYIMEPYTKQGEEEEWK